MPAPRGVVPYPPPTGAELLRPRAGAPPRLLVVVDTEEEFDWTKPFDRAQRSVEHMASIERFQAVCDRAGARPIYVVDHPIATQEPAVSALRAIHARGACEIGAHLHPWVTPPFDEEVNARNSYPGNLPPALERAKLATLRDAIETRLGVRPRAYKAGRYGFGAHTAQILDELGFRFDLSPCPPFDLGADGGPDWSAFPCEPFALPGARSIVAVPNTGAYVGVAGGAAHSLYRASQALLALHAPGVLARLGIVERLFLSPEGYELGDLVRLTRALLGRGVRTFAFSLHSPSVVPGHTPYVRTEADLAAFLERCERYFAYFTGEAGGTLATLDDVAPLARGA